MNRRHFLAVTCAAALFAACSKEPKAPVRQVSGNGRATAEEIFEAARTGVVPSRFSDSEREAVSKLR